MTGAIIACIVTAYTACDPGMDCRGITATGTRVTAGRTAAADWAHYPPGTRLWIAGVGWRTVEDRGGAVDGPARVDVFIPDRAAALAWGIRDTSCILWHDGHNRGAE